MLRSEDAKDRKGNLRNSSPSAPTDDADAENANVNGGGRWRSDAQAEGFCCLELW